MLQVSTWNEMVSFIEVTYYQAVKTIIAIKTIKTNFVIIL